MAGAHSGREDWIRRCATHPIECERIGRRTSCPPPQFARRPSQSRTYPGWYELIFRIVPIVVGSQFRGEHRGERIGFVAPRLTLAALGRASRVCRWTASSSEEPLFGSSHPTVSNQKALPSTGEGGLFRFSTWSGREDLNLRPPQPHCGALPGCATPRQNVKRNEGSNTTCCPRS